MLDRKLQLKAGKTVAVVDAPSEPPLEAVRAGLEKADAVLVYVRDGAGLDAKTGLLQDVAARGGVVWVAYPKARALGTDLDRDLIHDRLRERSLDCVRQVALDETWSAMRFKPLAERVGAA